LLGTPSQTVDAIAVILSEEGCAALLKEGAAVQFVMDAFGHLKAIGSSDAAKPLLDKAGVQPDAGITGLDKAFIAAAAKRFWDREPSLRTLA
jgi:catalase